MEEAIYLNEGVAECAVIGAPDKVWGERVVAYIIPKVDVSITADGLKAFPQNPPCSPSRYRKSIFSLQNFQKVRQEKFEKRNQETTS